MGPFDVQSLGQLHGHDRRIDYSQEAKHTSSQSAVVQQRQRGLPRDPALCGMQSTRSGRGIVRCVSSQGCHVICTKSCAPISIALSSRLSRSNSRSNTCRVNLILRMRMLTVLSWYDALYDKCLLQFVEIDSSHEETQGRSHRGKTEANTHFSNSTTPPNVAPAPTQSLKPPEATRPPVPLQSTPEDHARPSPGPQSSQLFVNPTLSPRPQHQIPLFHNRTESVKGPEQALLRRRRRARSAFKQALPRFHRHQLAVQIHRLQATQSSWLTILKRVQPRRYRPAA